METIRTRASDFIVDFTIMSNVESSVGGLEERRYVQDLPGHLIADGNRSCVHFHLVIARCVFENRAQGTAHLAVGVLQRDGYLELRGLLQVRGENRLVLL